VYTVEAVVLPRTEHSSDWCRRVFLADGMTQWEGANVAAYIILQDIMVQFPEVVAWATAEAFPRVDPYRPVWGQPGGNALEVSSDEAQSSAGPATSAMFAMMKTCACVMSVVDSMEHALHYANVKQLAQMTMQRDQVVQELETVQALNDALNEEIQQL
jgi:hypothetical protein